MLVDFRNKYTNNLKHHPIKSFSYKNVDAFYNNFNTNSNINTNIMKNDDNKTNENESINDFKINLETKLNDNNEENINNVSVNLGYMSIGEITNNNTNVEKTELKY